MPQPEKRPPVASASLNPDQLKTWKNLLESCPDTRDGADMIRQFIKNVGRDWEDRKQSGEKQFDAGRLALLAPHELTMRHKLVGLSRVQRQHFVTLLLDIPIADLYECLVRAASPGGIVTEDEPGSAT